ncbi:unnamed protein product [Dovyalis caffra]|uniref:Uncharacterized protein n=1 Tax=Dovyalis caffra TaxID=77055 RepID=A0AAV1RSK5_9ROSI|nr:unnamed protein product [Dovyalis caffra]
MMFRHLQFPPFAGRLQTAMKHVISERKCRAKDIGGDSTTQEVVDAVNGKKKILWSTNQNVWRKMTGLLTNRVAILNIQEGLCIGK